MAQNEDYSFELLPERVADSDEFTDQAHQHAADTLYEMISEDKHGVTIGIEGTLGSGKSTVINLLDQKMQAKPAGEDESKQVLFTFDAWAHSGDSLRRAFLVELASSLIEAVTEQNAKNALSGIRKQLTNREKVLRSRTEKSSTNFGTFLTFAALMVPVGAGILSGVDYSTLVAPWSPADKTISWPLFTGFLIAIGPLLALILYWRLRNPTELPEGETNNAALSRWSRIREINSECTDESLAFNLEPTSIEFESSFNKILSIAQQEGKISKVVIVLDNLDRIEQADLQNVWATLQTFFQKRSAPTSQDEKTSKDEKASQDEKQSIQNNVQFLVPFDREKFEDLWADKNTQLFTYRNADNLEPNNDSLERSKALSFLEKSLQATIDVPPVLPSSWVEYLKSCLDTALVNWPREEKTEAVECVKSLQSENPTPPTPRQIRAIINRAAPIKKRRGNQKSTKAVFSYAFHRHFESASAFRQRLLTANSPSASSRGTFDQDLLKEMSGILFGVTANRGLELLLQEPIIHAFQSNNANELIELANRFKNGFEVAMRNCKVRWMISESLSPEEQWHPSIALSALLDGYDLPQRKEYVEPFCDALKFQFLAWTSSGFEFAQTFAALVKHSEDKESHLCWLSENSKLLASDLFNNQPVASEARTRQLTKILQYLKSKNCSPRSFTPKRLSIDQWGRWLQICDRLNLDDDSEIFSLISLSEELTGEFIDTLDPNISGLNEPDLYALHRSVTLFPEDPNWRALADRTFQWFQQHSGNPELDSLYTLVFTLLLELDRGYTKNLRSVVSRDIFWQRLPDEEILCLNYLALIYMAVKDSNNLPNNDDVKFFCNNKHVSETCDQTLRFAEALSCTDEIWHLANAGLAHAKQIILQGESENLFSGEVGAKHLDKLSEGDFEESEIGYIAKKLIKFGSFSGILSEIRNDPVTYKKNISIFHKYGDQETRNEIQEILKTMSAEN